ncbi:VTT domain-containing protein [Leucobacter allii]|uniref:VTT domain-containing protein n=1 Tax=Leucobacter allii TaxID=2932247 RepID=A0ABY4FIV8_9MICO|nr:VTT domain-containing protein [Leucobacter allii]UOQ56330.1 VTT domain-containing protein [Leucobacter allii]UOR00796.1 VTT domain-containing protein [Leucobacter allii]
MDALPDLISALIVSPWLPILIAAVCIIDGFFPPVPSETTVVAVLATGIALGHDHWWIAAVAALAGLGAAAGDSVAFLIGRRFGLERLAWMRRPRMRRTTAWLAARVHAAPATLVLVGRYIPVGRVAVNALAGASGLHYRRFLAYSALASAAWAAMCVAIASVSVAWLGNPVYSALLAIGIMLLVGWGIDLVARRRMRAPSGAVAAGGPEAAGGAEAAG